MIHIWIKPGWRNAERYKEMESWVENNESTQFNQAGGRSWIDGHTYYHEVTCYSEEDAVMFILKFNDMCMI